MIKIELECNTVAEMTETLKSLLNTLTGGTVPQTKHAVDDIAGGKAKENIIIKPAPEKPAPAKPAPKPEPEPEEEPEEDLIGGELTTQDAIDAATVLVNSGKQTVVKAALKSVGADRVSNIPLSKVADFIAALG